MKKLIATLLALVMAFACVAVAAAEAPAAEAPAAEAPAAKLTLLGSITFNMDLDSVMAAYNESNPEIDRERAMEGIEFWELEYENVKNAEGFPADVKFLFVNDTLVALHLDCEDSVKYEEVKEALTKKYGEAIAFDAAKLGKGKYAVDDDGELKDCLDMILTDDLIIVLEKDRDGDVDVTFLDPTAAYLFS